MPGKVANLSVGIVADDAKFLDGINRATAAAEKFEREMNARTIAIGTAIGQNLGDAARELAMAFPQAFAAAADALDSFNDLKDSTGASIENISALDAIGRRTGATFEDVSSSLNKFNKTLQDAGDNVQGDIFRELGLDLDKLKKMDPAEAFLESAKALKTVDDEVQRGHYLLELFGKSSAKIAPYLNDVADAGQLVAVTTAEQAQAAEDYNKAIAAFQAGSQDAVRALANELLPALTETIKAFGTGGEAAGAFGSVVKTVFQTVAVVASDVAFVFKQTGQEIGAWAAQLGALARGDLQGFSAISDAVTKDAEKARRALDAYQRNVMNAGKSLSEMGLPEASYSNEGRGQSKPQGKGFADVAELERRRKAEEEAAKARERAAEAAQRAIERADESARKYIDNIEKQIFKAKDLTEVEKVLDDIEKKRVSFRDAAAAGRAIDAAARLDNAKAIEAAEKSAEESAKRLADAQRQVQDEVRALYESTRTPMETYLERLARIDELNAAGKLTGDLYARAIKQAGEAFDEASKKADDMSAAAKRAQENIQDALGAKLEEGLSGNWDNILADFGNLLRKMYAQAVAADIMAAIAGKKGGNTEALTSGIGGLLGGLFGGSGGIGDAGQGNYKAFYDSMQGFATGIDYVPEDGLYKLHEGETVKPRRYNPAAGGEGGGGNVVINNHGADVSQRKNSDGDLVVTVRNIARSMMLEDLSRGGEISQAGRQQMGWQRQNPRRG